MNDRAWAARRFLAGLALAVLLLAGCGTSSSTTSSVVSPASSSTTGAASSSTSTPASPAAISELSAAEDPQSSSFPSAAGRSLQAVAKLARSAGSLGAATGTFTPGTRRLGFAITSAGGAFIYAPTVVYVASSPGAPAQGPYPAPADPMTVPPQYRSEQNAGPGGIQAIYAAQIPIAHAGVYDVLSLTHGPGGLIGATGEIAVAGASPIPDVGQRPPSIVTDTPASVHGDIALLTTRVPPDDMHAVSFNQVLGKRPVALLFSTPQLCTSRVCGPVTDVVVSLEHEFAGRIAFIHEEVYVENRPSQGLRPQMKAFHLQTEPWLFTVDRRGVIVARLEGAFGVAEARQALEASLH